MTTVHEFELINGQWECKYCDTRRNEVELETSAFEHCAHHGLKPPYKNDPYDVNNVVEMWRVGRLGQAIKLLWRADKHPKDETSAALHDIKAALSILNDEIKFRSD